MRRKEIAVCLAQRLGKHPILVLSLASLGYRYSRDAYRMRNGEFDQQEFNTRAGGHLGGVTGSLGGASVGATLGSVIPGVGTILGGFAGGIVGEFAGTKLGRETVQYVRRWPLGDEATE